MPLAASRGFQNGLTEVVGKPPQFLRFFIFTHFLQHGRHIAHAPPIVIDARMKPWYPKELSSAPAIARKC